MIRIVITNKNKDIAFREFKLISFPFLKKYRQNLFFKKKKK